MRSLSPFLDERKMKLDWRIVAMKWPSGDGLECCVAGRDVSVKELKVSYAYNLHGKQWDSAIIDSHARVE